jgi:hypothetical protein
LLPLGLLLLTRPWLHLRHHRPVGGDDDARGNEQCPAQVHERILCYPRRIIQAIGRQVLYNNLPNASGRRQNA